MNVIVMEAKEKVVITVEDVIELAEQQGWTFKVLPYKGLLKMKMGNDDWTYEPYVGQFVPDEGLDRLQQLRDWVPVVDLIYAHEIEKPVDLPEITVPEFDVDWEKVGKILGISALVVAGICALPLLAIGAAILYDPALIAVIREGDDYIWLQIFSWLPQDGH